MEVSDTDVPGCHEINLRQSDGEAHCRNVVIFSLNFSDYSPYEHVFALPCLCFLQSDICLTPWKTFFWHLTANMCQHQSTALRFLSMVTECINSPLAAVTVSYS